MNEFNEIQKRMTLSHDVEIHATSDKIWDFLINIEINYQAWHPEDHVLFRWTKGAPFETGATFYAEQYMLGAKIKYKGRIIECMPGEKITMKFSFPLSLITEKIEMIIANQGENSTFRHITYMRFKFLSRTIFKKRNMKMLTDMDHHVRVEGENMKRLLEDIH